MLLAALQIRHFIYFARAFIFSARAFTGSSRELGSRPRGGFLCQNRTQVSLVPRPFCTSACAHPHNRMRVRKRRVWGNEWPSHGQKLECENGARMQLVRIMSVR